MAHLRIVPAEDDPRLLSPSATPPLEPPPHYDDTSYPSLVANGSVRPALPLPTYTYSEVLTLEGGRPPNMLEWLPLEIREKIWQARLDAMDDYFFISLRNYSVYTRSQTPRFLPAMCHISKSTKDETIGAFLRRATFQLHTDTDVNFLKEITASVAGGERHVRHLVFATFDYFSGYDHNTGELIPLNPRLELAVHYSALRTIRMTFGRYYLLHTIYNDDGLGTSSPYSVDELVTKYRLRRLLDCQNLRTVYFLGKNRGFEDLAVLQDLADWVDGEFASLKRLVECKVTWIF